MREHVCMHLHASRITLRYRSRICWPLSATERPAYALAAAIQRVSLQTLTVPESSLCLNRHEHGTSRGAAQPSAGPRHSRHQAGHAPPAAAATMPDIVLQQAEAQLGQLCREPVSIVRLLEVATLCPNPDIRLCGNKTTPHNTHAVVSRSCRYALVVLKKRISRCLTLRLGRPPTPLTLHLHLQPVEQAAARRPRQRAAVPDPAHVFRERVSRSLRPRAHRQLSSQDVFPSGHLAAAHAGASTLLPPLSLCDDVGRVGADVTIAEFSPEAGPFCEH